MLLYANKKKRQDRSSVFFRILLVLSLAENVTKVSYGVKYERKKYHRRAGKNKHRRDGRVDIVPEEMKKHNARNDGGCRLAVPVRTENDTALLHDNISAYSHKAFLDRGEDDRNDHKGESETQQDHNNELCSLICYGIKNLAHVTDHIEFSRDRTVDYIGGTGDDHHNTRVNVVLLKEEPYYNRHKTESHKRENVGDRYDLFLILIGFLNFHDFKNKPPNTTINYIINIL